MSMVARRSQQVAAHDDNPTDPATGSAEKRQARLAAGIAALRVRSSMPLERVLLIAGSVFLPVGVLLILLGWWGVSHSTLQVEQNSYLISGGLLGLALVITGGFFYFGYWLTRQVQEARQHNERVVTALTAIEACLSEAPARTERNGTGRAARPLRARPASSGDSAIDPEAPLLVATPNGTMLHRPDCAIVIDRDDLRRIPADTPGFTACQICQPLPAP
jgi:hypothetical protein